MRCRFEEGFTEEEKREIRAGLRALEVATKMLGVRLGASWRVERVKTKTWEGPMAHHTESGAELWARSSAELGREIHKAAAFLSRRQVVTT